MARTLSHATSGDTGRTPASAALRFARSAPVVRINRNFPAERGSYRPPDRAVSGPDCGRPPPPLVVHEPRAAALTQDERAKRGERDERGFWTPGAGFRGVRPRGLINSLVLEP